MAKRSKPPEPRSADLSPVQMKTALPKLERRISELKALDPNKVKERGDHNFEAIQLKIDDTLVEIFGNDTIEYDRYRIHTLDTASMNYMYETPLNEVREGYKKGVERATTNLQTIVDMFKERLSDLGDTTEGRVTKTFCELDLHTEIERATADLFKNGHYANAIEDSCKVLDSLVKMRSGRHDLSGTDLMLSVFSPKNPILKFNDGVTETDKSEQQGMMYICAGAMLAFRNPRAHGIIEDEPEVALEVISLVSFLAKSLDKAKRT